MRRFQGNTLIKDTHGQCRYISCIILGVVCLMFLIRGMIYMEITTRQQERLILGESDAQESFQKTNSLINKLNQSVTQLASMKTNNILPTNKSSIKIIFFSLTKPSDFSVRATIRSTWGFNLLFGKSSISKLLFPLGTENLNNITHESVFYEQAKFGDLILINDLVDTYKHLTIKVGKALIYIAQNFPDSSFVFKVDDDMFVNVKSIEHFLHNSFFKNLGMFVAGQSSGALFPMRYGKWKVSLEEYPFLTYPSYTLGCLYFMTMKTAKMIAQEFSKDIDRFVWEDIYFTGMLRKRLGIPLTTGYLFDSLNFKWGYVPMREQCSRPLFNINSVNLLYLFQAWVRNCPSETHAIFQEDFRFHG